MHKSCFECNIQQMKKLSHFLQLDKETKQKLIVLTNEYQSHCDMTKTNPEIMGEIWKLITPIIHNDNPYQKIKSYFNRLVLSVSDILKDKIKNGSFDYALKVAITGNLIDFAAKHSFNEQMLMQMLSQAEDTKLAIDDSKVMLQKIKNSQTLLYLGDNCGEIVLDKLFIGKIKAINPNIKVYYGVRGQPIVNDVTLEDAKETAMDEVATVISNGDGSLGTVLKRTSEDFQRLFENADMIISKGQGNYEGLYGNEKEDIFFLFMAKCHIVADPLGISTLSIVCQKNKRGKTY